MTNINSILTKIPSLEIYKNHMLNTNNKSLFVSKYWLMLFAILINLAIASPVYAQRVLRVGMEASFPPFSYKNEKNELTGFDYDIGNVICKQINAKCEWIEYDFDALIPALRDGELDMVISSMTITDERKGLVSFSDKYYVDSARLLVPKDLDVSDNLKEMEGKKVGVLTGSTADAYGKDILEKQGIRVVRYKTQLEVYIALLTNEIQGTLVDTIPVEVYFLTKPYGEDYKFVGQAYDDPKYFGEGIGIAVKKGNNTLLNELNEAIKATRENGKYQEIQSKYFKSDIYGN